MAVRAAVIAACAAITVATAGLSASAQARFATMSGTVVDESGGALVSATLALTNAQTQAKQEVHTNQTGFFEFVGLPAGSYVLEVRRIGFEPLKENMTLAVGDNLQRNVMLGVSSIQETVTVHDGSDEPVSSPSMQHAETNRAARRPCPSPAVGGCIGAPIKLNHVRPVYPVTLRNTGVEGTVLIAGVIGVDGRMKDMRVIASPNPDFERAALDAVGGWEFEPTTLNGRVIETRINVRLTFAAQ